METKPLPKDSILIINAHRRRGQDNFLQALNKLDTASIRLIAAHAIEESDRMVATVADEVASGAPMVIVGGDDDSMSAI